MSDRTVSTYDRRKQQVTLDAVRDLTGGSFDPDAWHVMDQRDNALIAEELINGALSSKFIYNFDLNGTGTAVSGISVVGARHLAAAYGGIKHRLVASVSKRGSLFTFKSYPMPGVPMTMSIARLEELGSEPDFYEALVEIEDIKAGNTVQMEKRESRLERRSAAARQRNQNLPEYFERPHYEVIAQSKAYRNAVLALIPQDVQLRWKAEMLKLGKGDQITGSLIDEKRNRVLQYAAAKALTVDRHAIEELTMAQLGGLAEAARTKDFEQFREAAEALGIVMRSAEQAERTVVSLGSAAPPGATKPAEDKPARTAGQDEGKPAASNETGDPSIRPPTERDEAWAKIDAEQQAQRKAADAARDADNGNGQPFEARLLDYLGNPVDEGVVYFDPKAYADALMAYLAPLAAERRAAALEHNETYIEAAERLGATFPAELYEPPFPDVAKVGAPPPLPDKLPGVHLVVPMIRDARGTPNLGKLVEDCKAELEHVADGDLGAWLEQNVAQWDRDALPPNTRAAIMRAYATRKGRPANPPPAPDANRAREDADAVYVLGEIAKIAKADDCREFSSNVAMAAVRQRLVNAGRTDLIKRISAAINAKAKELGYEWPTPTNGA